MKRDREKCFTPIEFLCWVSFWFIGVSYGRCRTAELYHFIVFPRSMCFGQTPCSALSFIVHLFICRSFPYSKELVTKPNALWSPAKSINFESSKISNGWRYVSVRRSQNGLLIFPRFTERCVCSDGNLIFRVAFFGSLFPANSFVYGLRNKRMRTDFGVNEENRYSRLS